MSRQSSLARIALLTTVTADNGAPSGDAGINLQTATTALSGQRLNGLEIGVAGGGGALSFDGFLWGRPPGSSQWSRVGSGVNIGHINGGTAITGNPAIAWLDGLDNLGWLERVYLEILNLTGAGFDLDATLIPIEER